MELKKLLRELDLGSSVAEFDTALDRYFIETEAFYALALDKADIIAGEKGTGKTALFRVFRQRYTSIPELEHVEVIAGFNPAGNPVFQRLVQIDSMSEAGYVTVWKAYLLSLVGNWLLELYESDQTKSMRDLDFMLLRVGLRSKDDSAETIFSKLVHLLSHWLKPKSAEVKFSMTDSGIPIIAPTLEFGTPEPTDAPPDLIPHEEALAMLNKALTEGNVTAWVVLDRLDEAFQGFPNIEVPALRALLRTYLDLLAYPNIRLKLFVRNDLFRKVIQGGFVNLTHVNARKIEIIWEEEDLLNLFCRRVRDSSDFVKDAELGDLSDKDMFDRIFPGQVDQGARKPTTWAWMMSRIRDGNGIKPPRNLIDLVAKAKEAQIRSEDRNARTYSPQSPIIEADSVRRALRALSDQRVQDTLLAEAADLAPMIERFRDGKAEHNSSSLAALLQVQEPAVRNTIKPLLEMGFLEETGSSYKVPMLYREGLAITQGKAFTAEPDMEEET
ncbi:MAG: P-loop ATPase, Sll1717 family [Bryobacteraceae bacterium]